MTPLVSSWPALTVGHSPVMPKKEDPPQMVMGVYRVNQWTGEKEVLRPTAGVEPGEPLMTAAFPPCECPRCGGKN